MRIRIYKAEDYWTVEISQGVQHFTMDYRGTEEEASWYANQLKIAFENFAKEIFADYKQGDVSITKSVSRFQPPKKEKQPPG